ncbi:MAG: hypothetical protein ACI9BD_000453 [Candidatus Marinamargulisbacteria bacterium]|jgi:hypothetical protein
MKVNNIQIILACGLVLLRLSTPILGAELTEIRDPFKPFDVSRLGELKPKKRTSKIEPSVQSRQKKRRVTLTGIIWDKKHPYAIVSVSGKKRVVAEGDELMGERIKKITQKEVLLNWNSKTLILKVGKEIVL